MKETLVGYYPLDEDSGSTAYDYSGNGNDGTANGAGPSGTGTVSGPLGTTAYDFDGTDDYITASSVNKPNPTESATLSCWYKPNDTSNKDSLIYLVNGSDSDALFLTADTDVLMGQHDGSSAVAASGGSLSNGNWYLVTGVLDYEADEVRIYLDGVEVGSASASKDGSRSTESMTIGRKPYNTSDYIGGAIADVRLYSRALSPVEVAYLYEVSQGGSYVSETKTL